MSRAKLKKWNGRSVYWVFDSAIIGVFKIAGNVLKTALLLGTSAGNVGISLLNPS